MRYNFLTSSQIIRRNYMAKSSVNFQKTKPNSVAETTRDFEAKYLLKKEYRQENSYWNCGKSDREIYDEQRAIYDEVKTGRGKRPSYENCVWEAVVNFNAEHTLEDMKKVSEHIAKKFNIIPTRIAMHRDEGHLNSNGEVVYNYHAHLNFVTLKDAQQNWTVSKTKHKLSELQTEVAEILGMERGEFKSEAKRLNHKQYRAEAKARERREQEKQELTQELKTNKEKNKELEQELLSEKEIKTILEAERKKLIAENKELQEKGEAPKYNAETYKELREIKNKPIKTRAELKEAIKEAKEKHTKKSFLRAKTDFEAVAQEQEQIIYEQTDQLEAFKKALEYEATHRAEIVKQELSDEKRKFEAKKEEFDAERDTIYNYKRTITSLEQRNERLQSEKDELHTANFRLKKSNKELEEKIKKQNDSNLSALNALEAKNKAEKEKNDKLQAEKEKNDLNANLSVSELSKMRFSDILELKQDQNQELEALKQENAELKDYFKKTISYIEPHTKKEILNNQEQIHNYKMQGIGENMISHKTAKDNLSFFEKLKELYTKLSEKLDIKLPSIKAREKKEKERELKKAKSQGIGR